MANRNSVPSPPEAVFQGNAYDADTSEGGSEGRNLTHHRPRQGPSAQISFKSFMFDTPQSGHTSYSSPIQTESPFSVSSPLWSPLGSEKVLLPGATRRFTADGNGAFHWDEMVNESSVRLWDGTQVDRDEGTGQWHFKPNSSSTIQALASYDPYARPPTPPLWLQERGTMRWSISTPKTTVPVAELPAKSSEKPTPPQPPEPPQIQFSKPHEVLFIINVCLAQFMSLAALAVTVAPLPIISKALDVTDLGVMSLYTAAYSLSIGTFILPAGRLGDMFGHKRVFLFGWLWFALWSLICGFSYKSGSTMLTACRAFQGLGPALLVPNGIALIGRNFPIGLKRNLAISFFGGCGPLGFVLGSVFSSIFSQLAWWPWTFWAMAIACLFAAMLSFFVIPMDMTQAYSVSLATLREKFDIPGAVTGVTGLVLINFALNQAPIVGWSVGYISFLLVFGIVSMITFIYIELRVAQHPLIPIKGLHRNAALTLACVACGWGSHGIWIYYMFLLIERIRGYTPLAACAQVWPVALVGFGAAASVPFLLKKIKVAYLMSMAMFFFMIGCLLLATAPAKQTYWTNVFFSVIITPLGMNWSFPAGTMLMSNAVPREHQGIAASLISTMVNYSISSGLGFAGSIASHVTPEHGALAGFRGAWYFGIGLSSLGFLISGYFIWHSRGKK